MSEAEADTGRPRSSSGAIYDDLIRARRPDNRIRSGFVLLIGLAIEYELELLIEAVVLLGPVKIQRAIAIREELVQLRARWLGQMECPTSRFKVKEAIRFRKIEKLRLPFCY